VNYNHCPRTWVPATLWISVFVIAFAVNLKISPDVCAGELPLVPVIKSDSEPTTQEEAKATATHQKEPSPGIIVLDTGNPDAKPSGERSDFRSTLSLFSADGRKLSVLSDLKQSATVGGTHSVAIDRQRGRIYFPENAAQRLTALDLQGKILWRLKSFDASAIAVDPKSGDVWCEVGGNLVDRKTIVVGVDGKILTEYPWGGVDIAYDPQADVFWIAGAQIMRVDRAGKISLRRPLPDLPGLPDVPAVINARNWLAVSITPDVVHTVGNAHCGGAWVAIRSHPNVMGSRNRLVRLDDKGETRTLIELGEVDPFAVAVDANGDCWVADRGKQLLQFNVDGQQVRQLPVSARAVMTDHKRGEMWVSTNEGLLRIDDEGRIIWQSKFGYRSEQTWLGVTGL
jgi:hypothetical protein